jgi:hypothetical protein
VIAVLRRIRRSYARVLTRRAGSLRPRRASLLPRMTADRGRSRTPADPALTTPGQDRSRSVASLAASPNRIAESVRMVTPKGSTQTVASSAPRRPAPGAVREMEAGLPRVSGPGSSRMVPATSNGAGTAAVQLAAADSRSWSRASPASSGSPVQLSTTFPAGARAITTTQRHAWYPAFAAVRVSACAASTSKAAWRTAWSRLNEVTVNYVPGVGDQTPGDGGRPCASDHWHLRGWSRPPWWWPHAALIELRKPSSLQHPGVQRRRVRDRAEDREGHGRDGAHQQQGIRPLLVRARHRDHLQVQRQLRHRLAAGESSATATDVHGRHRPAATHSPPAARLRPPGASRDDSRGPGPGAAPGRRRRLASGHLAVAHGLVPGR